MTRRYRLRRDLTYYWWVAAAAVFFALYPGFPFPGLLLSPACAVSMALALEGLRWSRTLILDEAQITLPQYAGGRIGWQGFNLSPGGSGGLALPRLVIPRERIASARLTDSGAIELTIDAANHPALVKARHGVVAFWPENASEVFEELRSRPAEARAVARDISPRVDNQVSAEHSLAASGIFESGKRYKVTGERWTMWLMLAGGALGSLGYAVYSLIFGDFEGRTVLAIGVTVAFLVGLGEPLYRLTNYLFFHEDRVDISTSTWLGKRSRRSCKIPYRTIEAVYRSDTGDEVEVVYPSASQRRDARWTYSNGGVPP